MLRNLLVVLGVVATTTANAENWQLLTDATNGVRMVVDVNSSKLTPYVKPDGAKSIAVSARMAYIDQTESLQFVAGIDGDECVYNGAGTIINIFPDQTKNNYFWSAQGTKLYDAQGSWLCNYLISFVEKQSNNPEVKQRSKPKISI